MESSGNIFEPNLYYKMIEIEYIESRGRKVSWDPSVNADLYPSGWFSNTDYDKKLEILKEAIEKDILIEQTDSYQSIIEGVKSNSSSARR